MPRDEKGRFCKSSASETVVAGVKGFDQNMQCRGFQYAVGNSYKTERAKACETGFHFCENPMDVFGYYPPGVSKYASVEGTGQIDKRVDDSKVACSELTVKAEIGLPGLVSLGVKYILGKVDFSKDKQYNTGNRSAATNTGYSSAATNTGDGSAATNTGYCSAATNTGYGSAATNTGNSSAATNTGNRSAATNTGEGSAATNTGYGSAAIVTGPDGKAKTGFYGCIALAWWNKESNRYEMRCAETGCGDGNDGKLKAHVWYRLDADGLFVETR